MTKTAAKTWADRQREKGIKLELQQYKTRNCWKKTINYKNKYFKHPITKAGYEAAMIEYAQLKAQISSERPNANIWQHHKTLFEEVQNYYDNHGAKNANEQKVAEQVDQFLQWIEETLSNPILPDRIPIGAFCTHRKRAQFYNEFVCDLPETTDFRLPTSNQGYSDFGTDSYKLPAKWEDRTSNTVVKSNRLPQTVGYWAERFLALKGAKTLNQQLKTKTLQDSREKLKKFRDWIGDDSLIVDITSSKLEEYYEFLLKQKFNNKQSYFNYSKSFIKYAWRQDDCNLENLPKNIDDRTTFTFRKTTKKVRVKSRLEQLWSKEDFANIDNLPERYQCWIMLMLNCGFTQTDLNELTRDEIDLKAGRIIRVRTKAEHYDNPPIVNYKLWSKTQELLERELAKYDHPEIALFSTRGARLITEELVTDAKTGEIIVKRFDNVSRQWQKIREDAGLAGKQLKFIRKTGTTTLKSDVRYMTLDWLYLGHTPETTADAHYAAKDGQIYKPLDQALSWLGKQFGFK